MSNRVSEIIDRFLELYPAQVQKISHPFDQVIETTPQFLLEIMESLASDFGFNYLADIAVVDNLLVFNVYYRVHTLPGNEQLVVVCPIPRENPELPSLIHIWPSADWQEREAYDLMGIKFMGHPNLVRILLPQEFKGHPLQKVKERGGNGDR